jgi:PAS domain S-box-containing protein
LTDWKREEVVGQDWFSKFLPPEIRQTIKSKFMKMMATGSFPAHYENEVLTKNGERRLIAWSNIVLRDTNGNVIGTTSIGEDITERKHTEEKLLQLQKAVETMQLGVTITDLDKKILYTNPADATMHGYTVEELLGQDARILAPTELRQPMTLQQIEESKNWTRESINIRKDGSRFPVQLSSDVVRDAAGKAIAFVTTCEDITERKRTEETIQESYKRIKRAERIAHVGHWEMDIATGNSIWSDEFFRICGFEPGTFEPTAEKGFQIIHPDDRERAAQGVQQAIEEKGGYHIEKRIVRPDGSIRTVLAKGAVICDEHENPLKLVGTFQDITERKQAEEALRENEENYRNLFSCAPNYNTIVDSNFMIKDINQVVPGIKKEDVIGKRVHDFVDPAYHDIMENTIKDVFETGKPSMYSSIALGLDGTQAYYDNYVGANKQAGNVVSVTIVGVDVTARSQAEQELEEHRQHLEDRVKERTAELQKTINLMAGREVRMAGLKKAIKKLRAQLEEAGMTPVADDPLLTGQKEHET